ncbi:hypothetical protein V8G54_010747 [Vigna mungo]|uniref:Uncharacterized protein n=1 Tax=Vigna mungo TaxID=3915 RepID=A0AAQ3NXN6_VIGMU
MSPPYSRQPCSPYYPYYSPPPPPQPPPPPPHCNKTNYTKPFPPPPPPPSPPPSNCNTTKPPPPISCNCSCVPNPPIVPPYPPPFKPYSSSPPPYIVVKHDYKAVLAVSASLGGILVAFLLLGGVVLLSRLIKKPLDYPLPSSQPTISPPHQYAPEYNQPPPPTTSSPPHQNAPENDQPPPPPAITSYQSIQIDEPGYGAADAGGDPPSEPDSVLVSHDHGHHNYG